VIESGIPRLTAAICLAASLFAFLALTAFGRPRPGLAIAVGLAIGGVNAWLAARSMSAGFGFGVTSMARIGLLSAVALAAGIAIDPAVAWLAVLGVAASQLVMSAVAIRSVL
jgi:hypothetical protein